MRRLTTTILSAVALILGMTVPANAEKEDFHDGDDARVTAGDLSFVRMKFRKGRMIYKVRYHDAPGDRLRIPIQVYVANRGQASAKPAYKSPPNFAVHHDIRTGETTVYKFSPQGVRKPHPRCSIKVKVAPEKRYLAFILDRPVCLRWATLVRSKIRSLSDTGKLLDTVPNKGWSEWLQRRKAYP